MWIALALGLVPMIARYHMVPEFWLLASPLLVAMVFAQGIVYRTLLAPYLVVRRALARLGARPSLSAGCGKMPPGLSHCGTSNPRCIE